MIKVQGSAKEVLFLDPKEETLRSKSGAEAAFFLLV